MARKRDYAAEYRRRQERAREAGFASYYQRRIRGGSAATPDTPAPTGFERRKRAGHAGAVELVHFIQPGDLIVCDIRACIIERHRERLFVEVPKTIYPEDPNRPEREFVLHHLTMSQMRALIDAEMLAGGVFSASPSLDQRRLLEYDHDGGSQVTVAASEGVYPEPAKAKPTKERGRK